MAGIGTQRLTVVLIACVAWTCIPGRASAMPWCPGVIRTLFDDLKDADAVLFCTWRDAGPTPNGLVPAETTEFTIEQVFKDHELLGGRKSLTLPGYVPPDKDGSRMLVFCEVEDGQLIPYRGAKFSAACDLAKYVRGILALKEQPLTVRLRYFFNYLENRDPEIALDAFQEWRRVEYADYRAMAWSLPADKLAAWLQDPNTPTSRHGLYAFLLGHCGQDRHVPLLRRLLKVSEQAGERAIDEVLTAYMLLRPDEGWAHLRTILTDPKQSFFIRYSALRTVRFFHEWRPEPWRQAEMIAGLGLLLDQADIADLAIEELRRWGCWELCDHVLALDGRESYDVPIIRRAILRYALSCPTRGAAGFVALARKCDAQGVADAEELLKLEAP